MTLLPGGTHPPPLCSPSAAGEGQQEGAFRLIVLLALRGAQTRIQIQVSTTLHACTFTPK